MTVIVKRLLPTTILALAIIWGTAWAKQPAVASTGLGQSWPNAVDVSASPHWHVYEFERDGIRYIQINDLNGTVREAFGIVGDQFLRLPIGTDSQRVSIVSQQVGTTGTLSSRREIVYRDDSTEIVTFLSDNGAIEWVVSSLQSAPASSKVSTLNAAECTGADCSIGHIMNSTQPH